MSAEEYALPIPDQIRDLPPDAQMIELARVWWGGDRPQMVLRPAVSDPRLVGAILAELAWHFSHGAADKHGADQAETLKAIIEGWADAHARADAARAGGSQ